MMQVTRVPGTEFDLEADLVLLAMGFLGPERGSLISQLGVKMTDRGNVWRDDSWMTSEPGVFTAGDMQRGQGDRRRAQRGAIGRDFSGGQNRVIGGGAATACVGRRYCRTLKKLRQICRFLLRADLRGFSLRNDPGRERARNRP